MSTVTKPLLTTSEAAKLLNVAPTTIRHWAQNGRLPFISTPGGHRRFEKNDVLSLMARPKKTQVNDFSILIVDDNKEFGDLLFELLGSYFPQVRLELAYNGFDAGDLLHRFKPDLVILDLMMSGINGFSVCKRIKTSPSMQHINVIAMTGALTEENVKRITELGAERCFGKPLDYSVMKEVISQFITNKSSV
ncbi:hypothetical protein A3Q34_19890 [Colwellia sp. PAMC 20917]|uniref:response regulator n=1 Tax=unclassified Colwellia TaxID=196834 RepID=UPI00087819E1|nr:MULTISPECIES: response regulator [unclassified Colwellia]AOW78905.1 hypothetical protein A3Q34_19890 [Colwellia sp. PAMC 20917]MBA6349853.1 response regulator [Colwellia sp. BRX8-9]